MTIKNNSRRIVAAALFLFCVCTSAQKTGGIFPNEANIAAVPPEIYIDKDGKDSMFGEPLSIWDPHISGRYTLPGEFDGKVTPSELEPDTLLFTRNSGELINWEIIKGLKGIFGSGFYSKRWGVDVTGDHSLRKYKTVLSDNVLSLAREVMGVKEAWKFYHSLSNLRLSLMETDLRGCAAAFSGISDAALSEHERFGFSSSPESEFLKTAKKRFPFYYKFRGLPPNSSPPPALLESLKEIELSIDAGLLLRVKNDPVYWVETMTAADSVNNRNAPAFFSLLSKCEKPPAAAVELVKKRLDKNLPDKSLCGENFLAIDFLLRHDPAYTRTLPPKLEETLKLDCFGGTQGFLIYYLKIAGVSKPLHQAVSNRTVKEMLSVWAKPLMTHAKITGDINKSLDYFQKHFGVGEDISKTLLEEETALSIENRVGMLEDVDINYKLMRFVKFHKQNLAAVEKMLKSPDKRRRDKAKDLLTIYFDPEELTPELKPVYEARVKEFSAEFGKPDNIRRLAKMALDKNTALLALKELCNEDDKAAGYAKLILCRQGTRILPELRAALMSEKDPMILSSICDIIAGMSIFGRPAAPELEKLALGSPDWDMKVAAIQALAETGAPESRPALETLSKNENKNVAKAAGTALSVLSGAVKK
jgi:hypothetical protein